MKKLFTHIFAAALIILTLATPTFAGTINSMALLGIGLGGIALFLSGVAFLMTLIILFVRPAAIILPLFIINTFCAIALGLLYLWLCIPENNGIELTLLLPFFWFVMNIIATILKPTFPYNLRAILRDGSTVFLIAIMFLSFARARKFALKRGINIAKSFGGDILSESNKLDFLNQMPEEPEQEPQQNNQDIDAKNTNSGGEMLIEIPELPPLFIAIMTKNTDKVAELIANGADVNERNVYFHTPLMYAVIYANEDIVKQLLNANADINATTPDETHLNALKLAALYDKPKIAEILKAAGAKGE